MKRIRKEGYFKDYYAKNKDKARANDLRKKFGMTVEQYDNLMKSQGGVCKICNKLPDNGRKLCVDHDHESSQIRGLLCDNCNRALGLFNDSVALMEEAISYLKK